MLHYWIALNSIHGLGPAGIKKLLSHYSSPKEIFEESDSTLRKDLFFSPDVIAQIKNPDTLDKAQHQVTWCQEREVTILSLMDKQYPTLLKETFSPPPILYVRGSPSLLSSTCIGIVGMRKSGPYGKQACEHFVKGLVDRGITIVSGLALGIDSIAHQTCLNQGGKTVAVLGCGVDKIYPASNKKLAQAILDQGAIISEFPPGTPPLHNHFPRRNRIISGLSAGVLVVEAAKKSGSLITAHYAMQQGRDVFAVPGSIFSERSMGTFHLIKEGAIPVRSVDSICDHIEVISHSALKSPPPSKPTAPPLHLLNEEEKRLLNTLSDTPQRVDQLSETIKKEVSELYTLLLNLELKGAVMQVAGQQYVKI